MPLAAKTPSAGQGRRQVLFRQRLPVRSAVVRDDELEPAFDRVAEGDAVPLVPEGRASKKPACGFARPPDRDQLLEFCKRSHVLGRLADADVVKHAVQMAIALTH